MNGSPTDPADLPEPTQPEVPAAVRGPAEPTASPAQPGGAPAEPGPHGAGPDDLTAQLSPAPEAPTEQFAAPPAPSGGLPVEAPAAATDLTADDLFQADGADEADETGAGAHRAGGRAGSESRWPLLAGLGALVLVGLGAVAWLLSSLPHAPARPHAAAVTSAPTSVAPSTSEPLITTPTAFPTTPVPRVPAIPVGPITAFRTVTPTPARTPAPPKTSPPPHGLVLVPNVVGQRQAAATTILRAAGFRVSAVPLALVRPGDVRRVIAESPPGGSAAPKGSVVTIYVTTGILVPVTG
jgi:serine/threonine-protein kinase